MGRKLEQSKKAYDKMAFDYNSTPDGRFTIAHKKELVKKVVIKDGDTILDAACGNGLLLAELTKKAEVNAYGIDISENMIKAAKEWCPNATFKTQPCFPLSFEKESLDVIMVSCGFHHFENPQGFANECMRTLKEKGKIYMAEPYFPPVIRWIANTIVFPIMRAGDVKVYSSKELAAFFEKAGFVDIQTYVKGTVLFFTASK